MGSRAVAVVCRTPAAARDWFGTEQAGLVYTRTGRRFFADTPMEEELLSRLRGAIEAAGLWDDLGDWAALDCEILPWSLKADELISSHYAAVGAAAVAGLGAATELLDAARARGLEVTGLRERTGQRRLAAESFVRAYRPYVWPVASLDDVRLAPFQVLAGSAGTCFGRDHEWHMEAAGRLAAADPLIKATRYLTADLADPGADAAVTAWWEELTGPAAREWWSSRPPRSPGAGTAWPSRGSSAGARSTCGSFTGRNTRWPATWPGCASAASGASGRWPAVNSRWESRPWSGSPAASLRSGCTSACSACSRWRASRSTRGCDAGGPGARRRSPGPGVPKATAVT